MDVAEASDPGTEAPAEAVAPEAPTTETAAPAEETGGGADLSAWERADLEREVGKLRRENLDRRHKMKAYDEAFGDLHPDMAAEVMDFTRAIRGQDGATVNSIVAGWADQLGLTKAEVKEAVAEATDDGDKPLTMKELEAAFAKQREAETSKQAEDRKKSEKAAADTKVAESIRATVKELGYDAEKDPDRHEHLYAVAARLRRESAGSLDAVEALKQADELVKLYRQSVIDEYRAPKARDAQRVVTPSGIGGTPTKDTTPTDLDEATRRATARLTAAQRQR